MRLELWLAGERHCIDAENPVELAIKQTFDHAQPAFFTENGATRTVLEHGHFIGDMARSGTCNVQTLHITPHCHGTHTEGVGHLTTSITDLIDHPPPPWLPTRVVSVQPLPLASTGEAYRAAQDPEEAVISAAMLSHALRKPCPPALVLRTLPNPRDKCSRHYRGSNSHPYFTQQAMHCIRQADIQHLLVDMPSIDRADDGGVLANHRVFWDLSAEHASAPPAAALGRTITEMIYVPETVSDGLYLLSLQLPRLGGDALPSRPLLFNLACRT